MKIKNHIKKVFLTIAMFSNVFEKKSGFFMGFMFCIVMYFILFEIQKGKVLIFCNALNIIGRL